MKNLSTLIPIILSFVLLSCSKAPSSIPDDSSTELIQNIGEKHNEALSYYYERMSSSRIGPSLDSITTHVLDYSLANGIIDSSQVSGLYAHAIATNYYGLDDLSNLEDSTLVTYFRNILSNSSVNSRLLKDKLVAFVDLVEDGAKPIDLKQFVTDELKSRSWGSSQSQADVFIDVFDSSHYFWSQFYIDHNIRDLKPGSKVIAADALGALHGLLFGPVGSIIEGAVVSIAVNEGWL